MESENQNVLDVLRESVQLIKALDLRVSELNASLCVVQNALAEILGQEAYKAVAKQDSLARSAAAGASTPDIDQLIVRLQRESL